MRAEDHSVLDSYRSRIDLCLVQQCSAMLSQAGCCTAGCLHRASKLAACLAGILIFGYSVYYYFARSDMSGLMQCSFFFGYMLMVCYALFLVLGTVGWATSLLTVLYIYRAAPSEAAQEGANAKLLEASHLLHSLPCAWQLGMPAHHCMSNCGS